MKYRKYKLTEKTGKHERLSNVKSRMFYRDEDDCYCYDLAGHLDYMLENELTELELLLAEKETNSNFFYCKFYCEVGDKADKLCGKNCKEYMPKNHKFGVCKHYNCEYSITDRRFTLKLLKNVDASN